MWWVLGLTALGAFLLRISPSTRAHSSLWCCGASLHRLLPIIELSKEFTDFFDSLPQQPQVPWQLNRIQRIYFAAHAIFGWIIGFFLIGAMSGLTQKG
jgi:hypothetical protein